MSYCKKFGLNVLFSMKENVMEETERDIFISIDKSLSCKSFLLMQFVLCFLHTLPFLQRSYRKHFIKQMFQLSLLLLFTIF